MSVEVRLVENAADFKAFFELPWKIYQNYPHWIPELPSMRRDILDKKKHVAWEYLEGDYFVAWRNGEAVGEIAAFINHRHNELHEEKMGFFGFFESIEDQEVATALFSAAETYLRAKGASAIRGPANFSVNDQIGVLIDSFDKDPMILMPYTPAYYLDLIERAGYHKVMDLYSWRGDSPQMREALFEADGTTDSRLVRATRRAMQRNHITVRTINMRQKQQEFLLLREIYHQAWEKNWGFIPMTDRELDNLVRDLGFLLMPEYTFFGMVKDQPAGFLLLVPNFNQVLKHVHAHPRYPEIWWLLKAAWHWKIRPKITTIRAVLMGVKAEYRGMGVEAALHLAFGEQFINDKRGLEWAEAGWVLETNDPPNQMLGHFGCVVHRKHRLYEKPLT